MTSKQKKGLGGSIDDVLGDLLGDGDDPPMKARSPAAGLGRPTGVLPSRSGKRSLLDSYFKLAEEAEKEDEASDVSEADPKALLESMKDMDDMDADLFGPKRKPSSAPVQSKTSGAVGSKHGAAKSEAEATSNQPVEPDERKPSSAPAATVRGYKKFSFMDDDKAVESPPAKQDDIDDPLGDLLDDLDQEPKRTLSGKTEKSPSPSPLRQKKEDIASPAPVYKKREELTFDDDEDDLMDALGFSDTPKVRGSALTPKKESEVPQRARTRLDEILGIGTSPRLLERPATGEKKDRTQSERPAEKTSERSAERQPQKSSAGKDSVIGEEDFTFGSYQPTVVSTPEGRQSRRQSVRFSTEDVSSHSPERRPKPSTPSTPTTTRPARPASDWLGLKQDENENEQDEQKDEMKESVGAEESLKPPPSPSHESGKPPSRAGQTSKSAEELRAVPSSPKTSKPTASSTQLQVEEEKTEEDWLAGALSKRKIQTVKRSEDREKRQEETLGLGEEIELDSFLSKRNATSTPRRRQEDTAMPRRQPSSDSLAVSGRQQSPTPAPVPSTGVQHMPATQHLNNQDPRAHLQQETRGQMPLSHPTVSWYMPTTVPSAMWLPQQRTGGENMAPVQQVGLSSTQPQVTLSADGIQQLLLQQQLAQAQLWGLGGPLELGSLQRQRRDAEQQTGEMTSLQAKIIQLEGQVRSLQLEKDQIQMLLDSVQQRHKQDTELMENTHRARMKLLEESATQREERARQENEDLAERLATVTRMAEQERAELQAQNQRRLAQCQQDRDREVERLRDLQRKSILEMKKDHEEQVQRLRRLKDEEIDAVTSATSQTRSLTAVIEQMEQFSRRLGDLSSRVEITHENTAQGLELGARQRDEQLRVLQERLTQQQREMTEERARLKEVIAKMDTQLAEQQRQLQQERWRVTAEQAKAESALRGLEEERRSMMQHFAMEREELERAKSALLEEQQTVMQRCAEERRKLAAEWTQFHTQEKVRQDRAEREASRAMEREAHREGTIISIAQEQAELKLRAGELKQREDVLQRERENLDKLREDLEREKEKLSAAALQLKSRAQEVESFSKLASERYEEGERALQEARQVETEHKARLRTIHTEMEQLRKQEQSLQQERMMMTDHCKEVERMRQSLPINPLPLSTAPTLPAFASTQVGAPVAIPPPVVNAVSSSVSPELQATLALLRHTAEKDRDFLQDEQFFLDTLKKTPYNSAFHTA
ncbi:fas-binding factor 1 homolog isoform X1 [Pygocentrus nattereri]|uniref:fas-binding factor 1 homolog isoform X1 n=1 Tax=Pygocentrus nattereri TaxID=42514 RepID=UPI0008147C55|nr:fas-binding factor 1 homolog isoform X1 [Pygocentrus nattereri]